MNDMRCPHCQFELAAPPNTPKVCPQCQQQITDEVNEADESMETYVSDDADLGTIDSADEPMATMMLNEDDEASEGGMETTDHQADSELPSDSDDDPNATFISDEFDSQTLPPDGPGKTVNDSSTDSSQNDVSSSYNKSFIEHSTLQSRDFVEGQSPSDLEDFDSSQDTFVSDEDLHDPNSVTWSEPGSAEAEQNEADQTYIESDADLDALGPKGSATEDFDSADQTYISDDQDLDSNQQTFISDESISGTVPSAHVTPDEENLDKTWGADIDEFGPMMTIKAKESVSVSGISSPLPTRSVTPEAKAQTNSEYQLLKVLGEGGMGTVWTAKQTSFQRQVALKMLKGGGKQKETARQKFVTEAIITGDLDHPNIVPVYDVGADRLGELFYSMKQVTGTPWHKKVRKLSRTENLDILMRVCDAVAFAHSRGIIHRDLKPENVMVGEFGEVLVMDWGLAYPLPEFQKREAVTISRSMGGTPAYMAPEMATGPIERITAESDVYLLGAILFEIVTRSPPHPGKSTQKCLIAAMKNEIRETSADQQQDELLLIALKALETRSEDRYSTVKEFQDAIRAYQDHVESRAIAEKAREDLLHALQTQQYEDFARSVFGFEQAVSLWDGNESAKRGAVKARLAYADVAFHRQDFDLALSLLEQDDAEYETLRQETQKAIDEREKRRQRFALLQRSIVGLILFIVAGGSYSYWKINNEKNKIEDQNIQIASQNAEILEKSAEVERQMHIAEDNEKKAIAQKERADENAIEAQQQAEAALKAEKLAKQQRDRAQQAEQLARKEEKAKQYEAYVATIGLAAAKIEDNSFRDARELLASCPPELRHWEWGRLSYLCSQSKTTIPLKAPGDGIALSPDQSTLAVAVWDGSVQLIDATTNQLKQKLQHQTTYVHSVAFSPDGQWLATGSADKGSEVKLWNLQTGELHRIGQGHTEPVVSVRFSPDGKWLASCSYDETVHLWELSSNTLTKRAVLDGHSWWVWDASFFPSQTESAIGWDLVSAGQDGRAIVWSFTQNQQQIVPVETGNYLRHEGPLFQVDVRTKDNRTQVLTAGQDGDVHLWSADEVAQASLKSLLSEENETQPIQLIATQDSPIRTLQVTADGEYMLTAGDDNAIRLYEIDSRKMVKTFRGHHAAVRDCLMNASGDSIYSVGQDEQLLVWGIEGHDPIRVLAGQQMSNHQDAVLGITFSSDGSQLATASRDRTAIVWDEATGQMRLTLAEGHDYLATSAHLMQQGRYLVTSAADNTTRIWSTETGGEIRQLTGTGRQGLLSATDNGDLFVTGSSNNGVQVWSLSAVLELSAEQMPQPLAKFGRSMINATAISLLPNQSHLLVGYQNGRISLVDLKNSEEVWSVRNHTAKITSFAFLPQEALFLSSSLDRTVGCGELTTGKELTSRVLSCQAPVKSVLVSENANQIITIANAISSSEQPVTRVASWTLNSNQKRWETSLPNEHANSSAMAPNSSQLFVATSSNQVRSLDLNNAQPNSPLPWKNLLGNEAGSLLFWGLCAIDQGQQLITLGGSDIRWWDVNSRQQKLSFRPHAAVAAIDFDPIRARLVTASWDQSLKFWDLSTGQMQAKIDQAHNAYINDVQFSPDGQLMVTASDDRTIRIWNAETLKLLNTLKGHSGAVTALHLSSDGKQLLSTSADKSAIIWSMESGEKVHQLIGHEWGLLSGLFDDSGQWVVTTSEDQTAKLWNRKTGELVITLAGHTAAITSATFSPDSRRLVTASRDSDAKIWDISFLTPMANQQADVVKELLTIKGHKREITSVEFSPDGRHLATSSRDGRAILWKASNWNPPAEVVSRGE